MRCWESPGDLLLVIEILVSFRCAPLAKRHKISITRGRSPGLSQERMEEPIILLLLQSDHNLFVAVQTEIRPQKLFQILHYTFYFVTKISWKPIVFEMPKSYFN
jgi:hypothetical protein